MLDVLDVLLDTGARIGEVLALRWEDVELRQDRPRVSITGTVVRSSEGLVRQDGPKSAGSMHRLYLAALGAAAFHRRDPDGWLVFPNSLGGLWEANNFRRVWREAMKAAGYAHVHSHMVWATVDMRLSKASGVSVASAQLGHSSEAITVRHSVERLADAPDAPEVFGNSVG